MAAIDTIYNYYLTTYGSNTPNRYDTHKKSELRSVYNNMVKVNKESPLYKILGLDSGEASRFAIDIKESSMSLSKVAASLSGDGNLLEGAFKKKVANSSDPDIVSVTYVGKEGGGEELNDSFSIQVNRLAESQINIGNYLNADEHDIPPGQYSFDFTNNATAYEFQYSVGSTDTNEDIQNKLARLVNTADIGAKARVDVDEQNRSSLIIESKETGLADSEEYLFKIMPATDRESQQAMETLGIDHVAREAHSSSFLLNDTEHSSLSNTFTINKEFEITLHGISEEDRPAIIGFENDLDAIAGNVGTLINSFNKSIETAESYRQSQSSDSKLLHDITSVSRAFRNDLEHLGLMVQDNGTIQINRDIFDEAISNDTDGNAFKELNNFKNAAAARASQIAINPMNYVNKVVVAYKNPGRNFNTPYANSMYAGMMLDRYC
ncbi:flagellar hook-associated protein 2 [Lachnospiraceae bacterium XBB1006]|nr:flagellar hook-associated protein 2 [Lachnospiraceae bacterium XBB1006]